MWSNTERCVAAQHVLSQWWRAGKKKSPCWPRLTVTGTVESSQHPGLGGVLNCLQADVSVKGGLNCRLNIRTLTTQLNWTFPPSELDFNKWLNTICCVAQKCWFLCAHTCFHWGLMTWWWFDSGVLEQGANRNTGGTWTQVENGSLTFFKALLQLEFDDFTVWCC